MNSAVLAPEAPKLIHIGAGRVGLEGSLAIPPSANGIVLFAHGSGSSRHSPRNRFVAERSRGRARDAAVRPADAKRRRRRVERHLRFDIGLLARRLVARPSGSARPDAPPAIGYFGASTGAARRSSRRRTARTSGPSSRAAAGPISPATRCWGPGRRRCSSSAATTRRDRLNQEALSADAPREQLVVVPGATHLFEEPGALARVADLAGAWFSRHLSTEARVRN